MPDLSDFEEDLVKFEDSVGGARAVFSAFDAELRKMRSTASETNREVAGLSRGITRGLKAGLEDVAFEGNKLSDTLRGLGRTMVEAAYNAAVNPVMKHVGGVIASGVEGLMGGVLPFAKGGAFTQGRVVPFATGGVVRGPVTFPMRGGAGLMGEAGPEAIMPLTRGPGGKLGVRSEGGNGSVQVVVNIQTPDVAGFQRSQSQIAAQMSRALSRAERNR